MNVDVERKLAGRVGLVTGSAGPLGRSIAVALAKRGAHVVLGHQGSRVLVEETAREVVASGGEAAIVEADPRDRAETAGLVTRALASCGRLDVLVHADLDDHGSLRGTAPADEILASWLSTAFCLSRAAIPSMLAARTGQLVFLVPGPWLSPKGAAPSSVASAHGLVGFAKAVAVETAHKGVRANVVAFDPSGEGALRAAETVCYVVTDATYATGNVFES